MTSTRALSLRIAAGGRVSIYRQIVEQVQRAISSGDLAVGAAMPSIRSLAEQLVVNPNTIAKAYAELAREGFIVAKRGRGMFVATRQAEASSSRARHRLEAVLKVFLDEALAQGMSAKQVRLLVDAALSANAHDGEEK